MNRYILVDKIPVLEPNIFKWATLFENLKVRRVAKDLVGDIYISTVFLGFDHNYTEEGPPLLFETMIFNGPHAYDMWRCSTWEQAEKQHKEALKLITLTK